MIPYIIQQASPSYDDYYYYRQNVNIIIDTIKSIEDVDHVFIEYVANNMYEFCNEEYGHGIEINSYEDFCEKFWTLSDIKLYEWNSVFVISYFTDEWNDWDVESHGDKIFEAYLAKCK